MVNPVELSFIEEDSPMVNPKELSFIEEDSSMVNPIELSYSIKDNFMGLTRIKIKVEPSFTHCVRPMLACPKTPNVLPLLMLMQAPTPIPPYRP